MFCAVIVTYNPDTNHVINMITAMRSQGFASIIYDNTPSESKNKLFPQCDGAIILRNGKNNGLGFAFNQSINYATSNMENIEGFIFFDQDSDVTTENLIRLVNSYYQLKKKGYPVGVIGLLPIDLQGKAYQVKEAKNKIPDLEKENYAVTEFVITSFSLVPMSTIDAIGLFNEELFIDLVDSEYSYRCSSEGLLNIVCKHTTFKHCVGEETRQVGKKRYAISSPLRNYYQARNLILVGRCHGGWIPFIMPRLLKRLIQVLLSSYYSGNFIARMRYFLSGIQDGIRRKSGSYSNINENVD